jgi:hypothetical protein
MEKSAKKSTRVSNLEKMSPEKRAKVLAFRENLGQELVDALNIGIKEDIERRQQQKLAEQNHANAESKENK